MDTDISTSIRIEVQVEAVDEIALVSQSGAATTRRAADVERAGASTERCAREGDVGELGGTGRAVEGMSSALAPALDCPAHWAPGAVAGAR
jgi:hypothetical protein